VIVSPTSRAGAGSTGGISRPGAGSGSSDGPPATTGQPSTQLRRSSNTGLRVKPTWVPNQGSASSTAW
jgi:hypothetical protein